MLLSVGQGPSPASLYFQKDMNIFVGYLLLACCHTAIAFVATATDFRFIICRKETNANRFFSKGTTAIHVSFQERNSEPKSSVDNEFIILLNDAIGFNVSAAGTLLSKLDDMRDNDKPQQDAESLLTTLLANGPDSSLPFWAKSKRLARFSRRARLASLKRTLDLTTPKTDGDNKNKDQRQPFRRSRALVALLRSLTSEDMSNTTGPAILTLEKKARQASREQAMDIRKRMPEGLETPEYDLLAERKFGRRTVEIRRYKPYSVCAVSMTKPRPVESRESDAKLQMPEVKGASSFGALAGYLFGKNDQSTAMKMTTPVFTSPIENGDREMEFVLPSGYWAPGKLDSAPKPLSGSGVVLKQRESEDRAVLMFGGYATKAEVDKRKKELMDSLKYDSQWKAVDKEATLAQYNDPFTVPWRRLNEVSVKVVKM